MAYFRILVFSLNLCVLLVLLFALVASGMWPLFIPVMLFCWNIFFAARVEHLKARKWHYLHNTVNILVMLFVLCGIMFLNDDKGMGNGGRLFCLLLALTSFFSLGLAAGAQPEESSTQPPDAAEILRPVPREDIEYIQRSVQRMEKHQWRFWLGAVLCLAFTFIIPYSPMVMIFQCVYLAVLLWLYLLTRASLRKRRAIVGLLRAGMPQAEAMLKVKTLSLSALEAEAATMPFTNPETGRVLDIDIWMTRVKNILVKEYGLAPETAETLAFNRPAAALAIRTGITADEAARKLAPAGAAVYASGGFSPSSPDFAHVAAQADLQAEARQEPSSLAIFFFGRENRTVKSRAFITLLVVLLITAYYYEYSDQLYLRAMHWLLVCLLVDFASMCLVLAALNARRKNYSVIRRKYGGNGVLLYVLTGIAWLYVADVNLTLLGKTATAAMGDETVKTYTLKKVDGRKCWRLSSEEGGSTELCDPPGHHDDLLQSGPIRLHAKAGWFGDVLIHPPGVAQHK